MRPAQSLMRNSRSRLLPSADNAVGYRVRTEVCNEQALRLLRK